MKKRILSAVLIALMLATPLTGCKGNSEEWISDVQWEEVKNENTASATDSDGDTTDSKSDSKKDNKSDNKKDNKKNNKKNNSSSSTTSSNKKKPTSQPNADNAIKTEYTGKDKNADYTVSGKVTVAINTNRPTDYEAMLDAFQAVYKNVDLEVIYYADSDNALNWVLKKASVNELPDVVFDDAASVPTYVAQGLLYPLDKYVANDPDVKYISNKILDTYKYGGKLFALPNSVHFSCVMINKDIVNDLNLKMPSLSWTVDDMVEFLKKGTTDKYSGCEQLFGSYTLASQLCPIYDSSVTLHGYDHTNQTFRLSSMTKGLNTMNELRNYPGLEAFALRLTGTDKYVAKFGNSNLSDSRMALKLGRTLEEFCSGTWEEPNLGNFKFNNTLWPYPQSTKGSMPIHVDHSMMMKTTKNPDAAFQLLRFITYSTEGNMARLGMYDKANKGKYALTSKIYFPVTTHPDVVAKFNSIELPSSISELYKYMYSNLSKCYRADPSKYMVDHSNVMKEAQNEWDKVNEGLKDAATVNATMEAKLNKKLAEANKELNAKISKHYG